MWLPRYRKLLPYAVALGLERSWCRRFAEELADEGEDEDIEYIDEDEIEELDDFEYDDEEVK